MLDNGAVGARLGEFDLDTIVTGDARELSRGIPDASIDLIFTDPVYQNIDDYRWLAETAARVLKPDSGCFAWIANPQMFKVGEVMSNYLNFVMPLNYTTPGGTYMLFSRKVFVWSTICLWYEKGKTKTYSAFPDSISSAKPPANGFKWNKNPEAIAKWMHSLTSRDSIVFDPFTGGGTVPAVCKMLGRHYLAFEIDPETAERARERVLNTQPPLFTLAPQQAELWEG
jgi:hypothetical protein